MKTIAKYTFKEMFNKKAMLFTVLLTIAFFIFYSMGLREAYRYTKMDVFALAALESQLISLGLYFGNFIIAFLVIISSVGAISGDIENHTMQTTLVKPICRFEIVLGKFLGYGAMVFIYSLLFFATVLLLNKVFGAKMIFKGLNVIQGAILFILGPIVLLSVCIWASSKFITNNAGILVVMLYFFAMVGGVLERIGNIIQTTGKSARGLINIGIISSLIMPTDVIYKKASSKLFTAGGLNLFSGNMLGGFSEPSTVMMIYVVIYMLAVLCFAVKNLENKDIG